MLLCRNVFLTPLQKNAIVRELLIDGLQVLTLGDKHKIHAVQFYERQELRGDDEAIDGLGKATDCPTPIRTPAIAYEVRLRILAQQVSLRYGWTNLLEGKARLGSYS